MKNIGFIGCGNMASAIIGGILAGGLADESHIMASCKTAGSAQAKAKELGIKVVTDNCEVAKFSDILFLCVKPIFFAGVMEELKDVAKGKIIVSIAAGQSLEKMQAVFGEDTKIVRTMPNTPALVGQGMTAVTPNDEAASDAEAMDAIMSIFESCGQAEIVPERLMDTVVGVSGSSPAYVYMFIEALAQEAVASGMPMKQAMKFAAQAVMGSAKMVLETGKHPAQLRDEVCSPGGTTIDAVLLLEEMGFKSVVMEAEKACIEKSKRL